MNKMLLTKHKAVKSFAHTGMRMMMTHITTFPRFGGEGGGWHNIQFLVEVAGEESGENLGRDL